MKIFKNYDLTKLNTFGVTAHAKLFVEITDISFLPELFDSSEFKNNEKLFLGGGSNILFTKDFNGIIILNKLKGIQILEEDQQNVLIKCMGGEIWHDLVTFAVEHGYWGLENLSLVPGSVGAAPMQNIGAYGGELKNVLENVEAYEISSGVKKVFHNKECEFGYRDSVFKNRLKGKYFISAITLKLSKIPQPNLSYKILSEHIQKNKIAITSSKDISDAVAHIRRSKLPDPNIIGNAGSFFKNIFLAKKDKIKLSELLHTHPTMPHFEEAGITKIPAAWLIEECGPAFGGASHRHSGASWKGYRVGNVGVHEKHALVLVNYGGGTGEEIKNLAEQIIASVYSKFGLKLIPEVNLI